MLNKIEVTYVQLKNTSLSFFLPLLLGEGWGEVSDVKVMLLLF